MSYEWHITPVRYIAQDVRLLLGMNERRLGDISDLWLILLSLTDIGYEYLTTTCVTSCMRSPPRYPNNEINAYDITL